MEEPDPKRVWNSGRKETFSNKVELPIVICGLLPESPFLVVTTITPFTPSGPYSVAAFAPFRTLTFSTSLGLIELIKPSGIGVPSTTSKAWLFPVRERIPRSTIRVSAPIPLLTVETFRPETLPTRPFCSFVTLAWVRSSFLIWATENPTSLGCFWIPKAVTMASSSKIPSSSTTSITLEVLVVTSFVEKPV